MHLWPSKMEVSELLDPERFFVEWFSGCSGELFYCTKRNFHGQFARIRASSSGIPQNVGLANLTGGPDYYFAPSTFQSADRRKDNAQNIPGIWGDLDFRKFRGGEAEALEHLIHFPFEPSFLIRSGDGFHVYWKFSFPQRPNNEVLVLLRQAANIVGGDASVAQFAALLRIPGTLNSKYAVSDRPGFVEVTMDPRSTGRRYSFEELFDAVKDRPLNISYSLNVGVEDYPPPPPPLPKIPEKFYALLKETEKVRRTWEGRRPDLRDQSHSGYDMSMTAQLVNQGYADEEILTVLMNMPSGKGGAGRIGYFMHGIRKARP